MIRPFLDLSSSHLSPDARQWLTSVALRSFDMEWPGWHVARHHDGWWMRVPSTEGNNPLPADLLPICDRARQMGADYILFDHDADCIDDLPVYE